MKCKYKIRNKYTGRELYVDCGKCPACLQRKALSRSAKIRANVIDGYTPLFIHLTYANEFIPYMRLSDLVITSTEENTPIYRDVHLTRKVSHGRYVFKVERKKILTYYSYTSLSSSQMFELSRSTLKSECKRDYKDYELNDKVGVLYYKDVQDFFKRLRKFLENDSQAKKALLGRQVKFYCTGEYGEGDARPHWHILLYVPSETIDNSLDFWKRAVCSNWLYAIDYVTTNRFEVAIDAAKYVAQYVNCSVDIPSFLQSHDFKPSWHYSQGFGLGYTAFSLPEIVRQINRNNVQYTRTITKKNGTSRDVTNPLPDYVTNRWFPKFKGFCHLSFDALYEIAERPTAIYKYISDCSLELEDCYRIVKRLTAIKERWSNIVSEYYPYYYVRFFQLKNKLRNEAFYSSPYSYDEYLQRYDNVLDIRAEKPHLLVSGRFMRFIRRSKSPWLLPSEYMCNIVDDNYFSQMYYDYVKLKKLNYAENSARPKLSEQ